MSRFGCARYVHILKWRKGTSILTCWQRVNIMVLVGMCGVSLLMKSWKWCVFSSSSSYSTCLPLHSLKYPFFSSTAVSSAWHIQSGSACSYQWDIFSLAGSPFYLTVDQFHTTGHSLQNPVEENVCSISTHSSSPKLRWIWSRMCSS